MCYLNRNELDHIRWTFGLFWKTLMKKLLILGNLRHFFGQITLKVKFDARNVFIL